MRLIGVGILAMSGVMAMGQAIKYPAARVSGQVDDYFGVKVADPYRWMEDVDSAEVKTWVDGENAVTQGYLADVPARAKIHARLMELNSYERISAPSRAGDRYFFSRNTGLQNQSVMYWQQGPAGEAHVLLDPNTLAADGTVSLGASSVSEDGKYWAYSLQEAGSDVAKVHVREVATGKDLPDLVEWVKFSGISWRKDGSGFYYSSFGVPKTPEERAQALKRANFNHKVYFHKLGMPQTDDAVVYERPDDKEFLLGANVTEDGKWLQLSASKGNFNQLFIKELAKPDAPPIVISPVDDAIYSVVDVVGREAVVYTTKNAPNGKVVKVDLNHPAASGWVTLIAEGKNSMEGITTAGERMLVSYLVDAKSEVNIYGYDGKFQHKVDLPGIGSAQVAYQKRNITETYFGFSNYTTPGTIYKLDVKTGAVALYRAPKLVFDPNLYETKQVFAPSKDGTKVPIFVTYKKGTPMDGSAPAILYGYGGFNVSLGPGYASSRLAWVEMGGIYAEAILRGGGEYGEKWHEAGTKLHKQNVFDDFIGCAEYLIANKYTSPKKLAINGGSNGGLLVGAVELQRPELFGAALAQVGVMDMLRFDKFTIGYAWKSDYGSPSENKVEFEAIYKYSPVHNVKAGVHYPPTLITTADHDDRVFPAHSFKFAAALQAAAEKTPGAAPMLIRVETRAGHGGGMPLSKQLDVTADMYGFLVKSLGMTY